ncbi:MAG TPA: hypothetical protein PLL69_07955 [Gemmatimonadales bacterium]|nr:hypothetical protein [Gemmatimonadales bacterium]
MHKSASAVIAVLVTACSTQQLPTPPPPPPPEPGVVEVSIEFLDQDAPEGGSFRFRILGQAGSTELMAGVVASMQVEPGSRTVILVSPDPGCTDQVADSKVVQVAAGASVQVEFRISCQARFGSVRLTTVTTGVEPDQDGYQLSFSELGRISIGSNETITFDKLLPAPRSITQLEGVADNCIRSGAFDGSKLRPLIRPVTVIPGSVTDVVVTIECHRVLRNVIAAHVKETGELWMVHPDGTGLAVVPLGRSITFGTLAISPDGHKVAWATDVVASTNSPANKGLKVMFPDGTLMADSHADQAHIVGPSWSFDSRRLVAETRTGTMLSVTADGSIATTLGTAHSGSLVSIDGPLLYNLDGTRISPDVSLNGSCFVPWCAWFEYPAISPDAQVVAHVCRREESDPVNTTLCVTDRQGVRHVVHPAVDQPFYPVWSPDGDALVYWSAQGIHVVPVDGSEAPRKLPFPEGAVRPSWSR